jgi:hypothetical protein
MTYETIFDIASTGYKSWSFPAFGLIFITAGIFLVLNRKALPGWWRGSPRASNAFAFVFLGFALLWTMYSFYLTYREYRCLVSSVETGSAKIVEGPVIDFKPMPATDKGWERFCVQHVCFEYSDYSITGGFNNTSSHGGPIREGLPVRITYVGGSIVKLEVAK